LSWPGVQIAVPERDAGRVLARNHLLRLEAAVAVAVAHRDDAARTGGEAGASSSHQRDVGVAVRRHRDVPRDPEAVGCDQRAEAGSQRDAAVVGVAGRCSAVET
jgi:hypothetical protein